MREPSSRTVIASCSAAVMTDQLAWIDDHSHPRKISEDNGRDSLAVACAADRLAQA